MKKMMLLTTLVAVVALMMAAAPAMAKVNNDNHNQLLKQDVRLDKEIVNNDNFRFHNFNNFDDFGFNRFNNFEGENGCFNFNCNNAAFNHNGFNHPFFNNGFNDNGVFQSSEQAVESGDSSQSFTVTGGGDNSNACQGIQGISNTGNAVNNTSVLQDNPFDNGFNHNHFFDGFNHPFFNGGFNQGEVEVSDSGNFEISPSSTTTCNQQVNQAASASGN